jgi:hypothetical protein
MIKKFNSNTVVIWPILLLFFLIPFEGFCNQDPPFNLIIRWKTPYDTSFVDQIRKDEELCCDFTITLIKSDSCYTEISTIEGEVIGILYGTVSRGFIKHLSPKFFESKYDLDRKRNAPLVIGG